MDSLISEDIREHYERRTVEWQWEMMRTLQTDVPDLNGTSRGHLRPSLEDTGCGTNNGPNDNLLFDHDTEMREETSRDNGAGVASDIVISDVQTPLIISGSSVSSKGSETSEAHIVEPLTNRSNNSGSSFESRTPRRKFQRP
jgi:hypothetical protein